MTRLSGLSLHEKFLEIALMDTSSPHDGAIFFSGPAAKKEAKKLAEKSNGTMKTVIDTPALKEFSQHQSYYFGKNAELSLEEGYFIGDCISEKFAQDASGTVRVFLDGIKPHGTFNRAEVPALLKNPNVDRFLVYDTTPSIHDITRFQEMEFNKADFATYIERKLVGLTDRRLGNKKETSLPSKSTPSSFFTYENN